MKRIFLIAASGILLSACGKDKKEDSCSQTMANIAGTYTYYKVESDKGSPGIFQNMTNDPDFSPVCIMDNKMTLNTNGTATYLDAGTVCSPAVNDNDGIWGLPSAGKIYISFPNEVLNTADATILSFDCNTLIIQTIDDGESTKITFKR